MALSAVQHSSNNLRIHHHLFNRSYSPTPSSVKMLSSSTSGVRLCSGLRKSNGIAPPPPCSIVRLPRWYKRYSNVSLSDVAADGDLCIFEKFTEKAMDIVTRAKVEAKRLGLGYDRFGEEHVLLAIITEGQSTAAKILTESMWIDNVEDARRVVHTFTKRGSRVDANGAFKLSIDIARKLGHDYVEIEHILLGLIPVDESNNTIVHNILIKIGVHPTTARNQLLRRMELDEQKTLLLEMYGTDLTKLAKTGPQATPVEHTEELAEQVINTLCTPINKNPCLLGKSRVENTEIVRKVAQQIACGEVPEEISGKRVIMLNMDRLVDAPEELRKKLYQEIRVQSGGIILFVWDIQSLIMTVGKYRLGDLIESGDLKCISTASTKEEYEKNKVVMTGLRFRPVEVPKTFITDYVFILRNFVSGKIRIEEEAILASVYLSLKYHIDHNLDSAFDWIVDANSLVKKNYYLRDVSEADIRSRVSLSGRFTFGVEEIAATKDIVAELTLVDQVKDLIYLEKPVGIAFTTRLRDRLAYSYNPTDFLEGKIESPVDSNFLDDLRDYIKNEIAKREIRDANVVVDFDAADNSIIIHEVA